MVQHAVPIPTRAAVQVLVWRTVFRAGVIPTSHIGHAAMQLNQGGSRGAYISWWPQGDGRKKGNAAPGQVGRRPSLDAKAEMSDRVRAGLVSGQIQPRALQQHHDRSASFVQAVSNFGQPLTPLMVERRWDMDVVPMGKAWMQLPDERIEIPALCAAVGNTATQFVWGLNQQEIAQWWRRWQVNRLYRMKSVHDNCAGAVKGGLQAGGSEWFQSLPKTLAYSDPTSVGRYARQVADVVARLNADTAVMQTAIDGTHALNRVPFARLWSADEWKQESNLGWLHPRSAELMKIDAALTHFHRAGSASFDTFGALAQLMQALCAYHRQKPQSQRRSSILALTRQVLFKANETASSRWAKGAING